MTSIPEQLAQRADALFGGCGEAVDWVRDVRPSAPRLDRDADGLTEKLRRTRNLCRRLGQAATRPVSIGVFGMSQAGKSYLISSLARAASGQLETDLDGERLNFIGHINPPGGGKEATGLVTRFTRHATKAPRGYPIELTLFTEADVVKILGNSFFNDFDRERVTFDVDPDRIREHVARYEKQRQPQPTGGLDEDDMVGLLDYFDHRYTRSNEPLKADFWPAAIDLAPRLPARARGELLSVLWGGIAGFTDVFVTLHDALETLSGAGQVYVPLEALVVRTGDHYEWSADSLLNVDVLDRLGRDEDAPLAVLPVVGGETKPEVAVPRSLLAVLTAEMKFVLADPPAAEMLESVDLLDFPGYRGRLKIASLEEATQQLKDEGGDPIARLLLRGKVAYLFERYTEDQEMNVLIMCTRCDQQIEVETLHPVLSSWVHSTQGATPESRGSRPSGLVWAITQFDLRLVPKPGLSSTQERQEWANLMHITLLERFSQCEWLQDWSGDSPFDNVFLMRKPGLLSAVIETSETGEEGGIRDDQQERLGRARQFFLENESVAKHIRDAGTAWDAVLGLNDGGMNRLAGYLATAALLEAKLGRIDEQLTELTGEIAEHRLGGYFHAEGAGAVEKKKELAGQVSAAIADYPDGFGELLRMLQPASEQMRRLYLRADAPEEGGEKSDGDAPPPKRRSSLVKLPLAPKGASESAAPAASSRAVRFAKSVMSEWTKQLRNLADHSEIQRFLGIPSEVLQALTDELITASDRQKIEQRLVEILNRLEEKRSTTRSGIVDQQVLQARLAVADYVDTLGLSETPVADRPQVDGRRLFEPPAPIEGKTLPELPDEEVSYTGTFILDWLEAFRLLAIDNAGHSAGREITPEQNDRLGAILTRIRGDGAAAA